MYIAIDGGGTKTEYLLLNVQFEIIERYLGGCVNHDFLPNGWEGTMAELRNGITVLLGRRNLQISEVKDVTAGLSGIDTGLDQQCIERCMAELGIQKFAVCNDGFLSIMAECPDGWGIAYNCGTGVCCAAIDEKNNRMKMAGLDDWSGDAGGGTWIVMEVFRQIYKDLFFRREETSFAKKYMQMLGLKTDADFVDSWSRLKEPSKYPELQKMIIHFLFEQFEAGEEEADLIVNKMLQCASDNIHAVIKGLEFSHSVIPLVLSGSIHTKAANRKYLCSLNERLKKLTDNRLNICIAEKAPVWGAVQWLKNRNNGENY